MIIPYFIGAIFPKECCQEWEVRKKRHKGGGVGVGAFRVEVVYRRGGGGGRVKTFYTLQT